MIDFDRLLAWLRAWHDTGRAAAAGRFCEHFLLEAAERVVAPLGLRPADAEDARQELVCLFLDRDRPVGLEAESLGYWFWWLRRRARDLARKARRTSKKERPDSATVRGDDGRTFIDGSSEHDATPELDLIGHLDRPGAVAALRSAGEKLAADRRLYLFAYHPELHSLLSDADLDRLEGRSGLGRTGVLALLDGADGRSAEPLLPLFFRAADLEGDGRDRKLDTFRKGRKRAFGDLVRHLGTSLEGVS
ncbi:MAG: hypothetical protein KC461_12080 [Dehalococcoidia bacterium]|nr:hypothetical protein [Dehalococcoidia bacterium]